ncbi:MAG: hypothetical protein KF855_03765 [Acidobacteria bacterium]|nr:hypothetical protein [Acidobacteriota bacterium]
MSDAKIVAELEVIDKSGQTLDRYQNKIQVTAKQIEDLGKGQVQLDTRPAEASVDRLTVKLREVELLKKQLEKPLKNPLNPSGADRLTELGFGNPNKLPMQGPADPYSNKWTQVLQNNPFASTNSFAKEVKELAPHIQKAREEQEKYKKDLQSILGLRENEAALLAKIPLSYGAIAAAGAAAIAATYLITGQIRDLAEQRLRTEEKITAEFNKQILEQQKLSQEFEKQRRYASEDRQFDRTASQYSLEDAMARRDKERSRLDYLRGQNKLVPGWADEGDLKQMEQQILKLDALIDKLQQERRSAPLASFNQRYDEWKKQQENILKAEQKWQESVEKGKQRVDEYKRSVDQLVSGIAAKSGSDNPFVRVFSEADESMKRAREITRGLSKDLQTVILAQQKAINDRNLFSQKLESGLRASDLRQQADNFRNPYSKEAEQMAFLQKWGARQNEQGAWDIGDRRPDDLMAFLKGAHRLGINAAGRFDTTNPDAVRNILKNIASTPTVEQEKERKRFDEIFQKTFLGVGNADQQAIADKMFIQRTAQFNAGDLTDAQRTEAASAREREAVRTEQAAIDAAKHQKDQTKLQEKILEEFKNLNKRAEKQGEAGIKNALDITIKNESDAAVETQQPTPQDTANYYGRGLATSGIGGLSNR